MKRIIAETERDAFTQTPPKDGSPTAKWVPRTPPRPEQMPPTAGSPQSLSPDKRVDVRITPAVMRGSSSTIRPDTTSSGLSRTRPQGVSPVLGIGKPPSQSPPKSLTSRSQTHDPPPLTRTQSTQVFQPIIPIKRGASSPGVRRTSWVTFPSVTLS